MRDAG